jgi:hypothetical protein
VKPFDSVKASWLIGFAPAFSDVVAGDRYRVEVLHVVLDEVLLDVAHHLERELGREDAGVLPLVFLEDVGLHGAADCLKVSDSYLFNSPLNQEDVNSIPETSRLAGRWPVLKNIARIVGAGPLMVIDTELFGAQQVESRVEHLPCRPAWRWKRRNCRPCRRCRALVGIEAVERHESKAVDRRLAGMSFDSRWKRGWCGTGRPRPRTCASGPRFRA